ncbi:VOC family protein [Persephonella sp.]
MYRVHHTAISVSNMEKTLQFYSRFGFVEVASYEDPDGNFSVKHLKLGDFILEVFWFKELNKSKPLPLWEDLKNSGYRHIALQVDNIYETLDLLKAEGIAESQTEVQRGKTGILYFFIRDPDGNFVEIVEDKRFERKGE